VWPDEWRRGSIIPIIKAGGKRSNPNDYRGISLLPVLSKCFEAILNTRLNTYFESAHALADEQYGFRAGRSTLDAALLLYEAVAQTREQRTRSQYRSQPLFTAFLDVSKAYDKCWRAGIIAQCTARGVPANIIAVLSDWMKGVTRHVVIDGHASEPFSVHTGVPQGAVLSPTLYNTFIDGLARTLNADDRQFGVVVGGQRVACILYADDILLLADSADQLQCMLDVCTAYAREWLFEFNAKKSCVLVIGLSEKERADNKYRCKHPFTICNKAIDTDTTYKHYSVMPDDDGCGLKLVPVAARHRTIVSLPVVHPTSLPLSIPHLP
jgi:hypothetical protein